MNFLLNRIPLPFPLPHPDTFEGSWTIDDFFQKDVHTKFIQPERKQIAFTFKINRKENPEFTINITLVQGDVPLKPTFTFEIINLSDETKILKNSEEFTFTSTENEFNFPFSMTYSDLNDLDYINNNTIIINFKIENMDSKTTKFPPITELESSISQQNPLFPLSIPSLQSTSSDIPRSRTTNEFSGLINQGSTCYLNSMVQSLYHIPLFRYLIFQMDPDDIKPSETNIESSQNADAIIHKKKKTLQNLKLLFARMQLKRGTSISTKNLTQAMGITDMDVLEQRDIQEFGHILIDSVGKANNIFKGKYRSYKRLININEKITNDEEYMDISLVVDEDECTDVHKSFEKYVEEEKLDGDNLYETEKYGKQEAEIGVEFLSFPKVLYLHLKRFAYNTKTQSLEKISSRYTFPKQLNLNEFLSSSADKSVDCNYELFGVIVHSGSPSFGHYYIYLRPSIKEEWYKFNDTAVTIETEESAIENNFGGKTSDSEIFNKPYSAYILVYVRVSDIPEVFRDVSDNDIPESVKQDLEKMIQDEIKEENEKSRRAALLIQNSSPSSPVHARPSMMSSLHRYNPQTTFGSKKKRIYTVNTLQLDAENGECWFDYMKGKINVNGNMTIDGLYETLADKLGYSSSAICAWAVSENMELSFVHPDEENNCYQYNDIDGFFVISRKDVGLGGIELTYDPDENLLTFIYFYISDIPDPLRLYEIRAEQRSTKIIDILNSIHYKMYKENASEDDIENKFVCYRLEIDSSNAQDSFYVLQKSQIQNSLGYNSISKECCVLVVSVLYEDPLALIANPNRKRNIQVNNSDDEDYSSTDQNSSIFSFIRSGLNPDDAPDYIMFAQTLSVVGISYFPITNAQIINNDNDDIQNSFSNFENVNEILKESALSIAIPENITGSQFFNFVSLIFQLEVSDDSKLLLWRNNSPHPILLDTDMNLIDSTECQVEEIKKLIFTICESEDEIELFQSCSRVVFDITDKFQQIKERHRICFAPHDMTVGAFVEFIETYYGYNLIPIKIRKSIVDRVIKSDLQIKNLRSTYITLTTIEDKDYDEDQLFFIHERNENFKRISFYSAFLINQLEPIDSVIMKICELLDYNNIKLYRVDPKGNYEELSIVSTFHDAMEGHKNAFFIKSDEDP